MLNGNSVAFKNGPFDAFILIFYKSYKFYTVD